MCTHPHLSDEMVLVDVPVPCVLIEKCFVNLYCKTDQTFQGLLRERFLMPTYSLDSSNKPDSAPELHMHTRTSKIRMSIIQLLVHHSQADNPQPLVSAALAIPNCRNSSSTRARWCSAMLALSMWLTALKIRTDST